MKSSIEEGRIIEVAMEAKVEVTNQVTIITMVRLRI